MALDLQLGGDGLHRVGAHVARAGLGDLRAQPAQVEEQALFRGGGADPHDGPVAQDVVLYRRADPPDGVGGKPHLAIWIETLGGLQEAQITLLDQVRGRKTVTAELAGEADHKPRVGTDHLVHRPLVALLDPGAGQFGFFLAGQQRRVHRIADELTVGAIAVEDGGRGHHVLRSCSGILRDG